MCAHMNVNTTHTCVYTHECKHDPYIVYTCESFTSTHMSIVYNSYRTCTHAHHWHVYIHARANHWHVFIHARHRVCTDCNYWHVYIHALFAHANHWHVYIPAMFANHIVYVHMSMVLTFDMCTYMRDIVYVRMPSIDMCTYMHCLQLTTCM